MMEEKNDERVRSLWLDSHTPALSARTRKLEYWEEYVRRRRRRFDELEGAYHSPLGLVFSYTCIHSLVIREDKRSETSIFYSLFVYISKHQVNIKSKE
jgi:hypothetical protein